MLVPQQGRLRLATELGLIDLEPLEIAVIPRGVRFRVELLDDTARGYMLENFGAALRLPELGPIGSNCLANSRDFKTPVAWYEDVEGDFELIAKFTGGWRASIGHSPLDVVAWHGTHAPYKYDLQLQHHRLDQLRPSRSVDLHGADRPSDTRARPTWTSPSSRRASWRWKTPSVRPGSTATSPANSWA